MFEKTPNKMDLPNAEKQVNEDVEFILVGAGLPRTGTLSTWTALEKILPGKCHHMLRAFTGKNDGAFWTKASRGELSDEDWREFIRSEQLSACVDYPMSLFWKDLATLYPKAKVLLTVRDPVRWYTSVKNTIRNIQVFMSSSLLAAPLRLGLTNFLICIWSQFLHCHIPFYLLRNYFLHQHKQVYDNAM